MSQDIKRYYALLGVRFDANADQIKSAYRRLAKLHHPDVSGAADGGAKFHKITEAYGVLSDPDSRARYDSESVTAGDDHSRTGSTNVIDPITCYSCKQVTAQPRYIVFRTVISLLVTTIRKPVQGIYCSSCAAKIAWKANLITAFAGWWGFPWGPIYTIGDGINNAFGGTTDQKNNEQMLWYNALAFASRGDLKLAYTLAQKVARSTITDRSEQAIQFLNMLQSHGANYDGTALTDPWKKNRRAAFGQLFLIAILPMLLVIFIAVNEGTGSSTYAADGGSRSYSTLPTSAPAASFSTQTADTEAAPEKPTCSHQLKNNERLGGNMALGDSGHIIEIENGSSGDAIVKIRKSVSQQLVRSFWVAQNQKASIMGLPDDDYTIQYAFGDVLGKDCKSFNNLTAAGEFPNAGYLITQREEVAEGTMISHHRLSYTLYSVPSGNVKPKAIDASMFNAE